jgi:RNA polymerase sigma-70 factor, ECF subfamily
LRTYATGILKHKIVDLIRRKGRELPIEPLDEQSYDEAIDALFLGDGHWRDKPLDWPTPESALDQRQFMARLFECIERLPTKIARAFVMRETMERETSEICADLDITANHCGVLLYRARMQLRECLEQHWVRGRAAAPARAAPAAKAAVSRSAPKPS